MSKRRRRNSRRRKSSSSSKHGISPCNFQKQACPVHNVVNEDDIEEKGQSDSFHKENMSSETDEEENKAEIPSKEKIIRTGSCGNSFRGKKAADTTGLDDQDKGVKITTSVMIDDSEISTPRVVFQRSHESGAGGAVSSIIAVTTAKIKSVSPNMRLEIQELWQSFDTDLKTTVVLQSQKGEDKTCFQSQRSQTCQESPNSTEFGQYREHDNVSIKVSIAELNVDVKDTMKNPRSCQCHDEMDCCKSCCEDHFYSHNAFGHSDTDFTVVDGSSSLSASSDFWPKVKRLSLPTSTSHEAMWDIPPPQEFADKQCDILDGLSENIAACQISADDHDANQGESPAIPDALQNNVECNCHSSFDREDRVRSDLDSNERFFKRPKTPMSRSSFTKNFVHSHERQSRIRNNSFTILETKTGASGYMESPAKRRKTFPGETDDISQRQDTMPCYRESFSSGSLTSFFSQSFPLQAQRSDRYYLEDEGHFPFAESRKASSTSSYRPSSSSIGGQDTFLSSLMAYRKTKNPFYPSRSDETEDFLLKNGQTPAQKDNITMVSMMAAGGVLCLEGADQESSSAGPKCEVTESGFDEDMIDLEEGNLESIMQEPGRRDLLIRVTPPTPYTSEDHISDGVFTRANEDITVKPTTFVYEGPASDTAQRKRGNSVTTVIIGDFEQRFLHNDPKPVNRDTSEKRQQDTITVSPVSEEPAVFPTDVPETGRSSDVTVKLSPLCEEPTVSPPDVPEIGMGSDVMVSLNSQTAESSSSSQIAIKPTELKVNTTISSEKPNNVSSPQDSNGDSAIPSQNIHTQTNQIQDKGSTDGQRATKLAQRDSAERQSVTKSSLEVKEHLRPLADPVHKDPEDPPDHWAKRRKLFKESREWSSAGGSSFTSIITEESDTMNSEDTRSVDMSVRDIEDRGFYTETFHSASWIYRGDDVNPTEGPACLSNRPRPVTIRDRTVKIIKGTGDYPWGFRIQYSKPIVVTEVDTNGAAEEAGLLVGDYVLAVNGTDVTSVPHSEAADLARQGPDLLTLIIGSDISRCPNTPRPACRGYLHKRTQSSLLKGWRKRWFVLRHDCCLYYYRNKRDEGKSTAFTSMKLEGAVVEADSSLGKPFVFKCCPVSGNRVYYFCATSNQEMKRWLEAMDRAVHPVTQNHVWVDVTRHNSSLPPLAVKNPECLGLLHQLDVNKDAWMQHYSILKDGCLYFYASIRSTSALGGIYLHGYTVREQPFGSKRSAIELKPPSEEFKTFIMCAENANENKRWILAIKSSIGKWLPLHQAIQDFMNRPPEETRM